MFHKLLHRGLPGWFDFNSVYAMQPMYTSPANERILTKLKTIDQFSKKVPSAPKAPQVVNTHAEIIRVLGNISEYEAAWTPSREALTPPGLSARFNCFQQKMSGDQIYKGVDVKAIFSSYVKDKARAYLERDRFELGNTGYQVDFIRE